MNFFKKLKYSIKNNNSLLCVGLDPDFKKNIDLFTFNKSIIDATNDLVCAYKPNIAFYAAQGLIGLKALIQTIEYIHTKYPNIPVILDAKRGDIQSSAKFYATEAFEVFKADAVTVSPFLGLDSLIPFLQNEDKGIIILAKTSNTSSQDFQDLEIDKQELYLRIAKKITEWNKIYKNCLMVVGATWPEQLSKIRKIAPKMFLLIPGIGTQGGDLNKTLKYGLRKDGSGLIINSSRGIIFSENPRIHALKLRDEINKYR